ncbi:phage tail protein [Photobacterium swingsii]|uniref:phage tail protein n=1 Tax=Photobacterium swingsii TaxID=680026 RepID=UPI003D0F8203
MAGLSAATIISIVSAAASVVSMAISLSAMSDQQGSKDSGATIDRKGQDNPKVVAFGNCLVPSVRVWNNVNNSDTEWLAQAHSFGIGQLKSIDEIYIDDVQYGVLGVNQWHDLKTSSNFPNVCLGLRTGRKTEEAYSQLFEHSDNEWTSANRGDRTASASFLIERWLPEGDDNDIRVMSDRFKVEAMVQGNAVIDPRYDSGLNGAANWESRTWNSYRNPACVMLTYLVDTYYGLGLPTDSINIKSFIDLANYCDDMGMKFDGYVDQNQDFGKVLVDMATSFDGIVYLEDGLVTVKSDRLTAPVATITESDCVGSFKLSNSNDSNYYNIVNVEYINAATNYSKDKYVLPKDATAIHKRDGFEKVQNVKLPYTLEHDGSKSVKRIANKMLKRVNFQKTIEFELDNTKKSLKLYDVFTISNEAYSLDKKQFRVDRIVTSLDDKTTISKVTATEYEPSIYDHSDYEDGNSSKPVKPPKPIQSPVSLAFAQTGYTTTGQGRLSWVPRYLKEHRTVVEYKLSSATSWTRLGEVKSNKYDLSNLYPDSYDFRVMTQTFMGSTSQWTTITNVKIQGGIPLPTVTGLKATFTTKSCFVSWNDMTTTKLPNSNQPNSNGVYTVSDVFSHYEVRVFGGSNNVYKETLSSVTNHFEYTFEQNVQSDLDRDLRFEVLVVAKDGSISLTAGKVDAFNNQVQQPISVEVNGELSKLSVSWEHPSEVDYTGTDVHISKDTAFTPSNATLVATSTAPFVELVGEYEGVHYLRVGHYDCFGKQGMSYSAPITFTQKTIDDILENSPSFGGVIGDLTEVNDKIDQEITTVTNKINTDVAAANAKIDREITEAEKKITANASSINTINTTLGNHNASISSNATAIESVEGNLSSYKTVVQSKFDTANANITNNQKAITTNENAITSLESSVTAQFEDTNANISSNSEAIADANEAIVNQNSSLTAEINKNKANISSNASAIVKANEAIVSQNNSLTAEINKNKANISSNASAIVETNKVVATQNSTLTAAIDKNKASIASNASAIVETNKAIVNQNSSLTAEINKNKANISSNSTAIAETDRTVATLNNTVSANFNTLNAKISTNATAIANNKQALTEYKTEVAAEFGDVKASVTENSQAIVDVDGKASATHEIALEVNGKTSGLIMGNNGTTSTTDVIADKFRVSTTAGGQAVFQVVDGVVSMRNALIKDLNANNIQAGSISGNNISSKTRIMAGSGAHSASLDGTNFDWRIYAGSSHADQAPFRVSKTGKLYATDADITGRIVATSGTFSGDLQVKSSDSGARMEITNEVITVYDEHGRVRVKIGKIR